jgi:hypothetical protein
MHSAVCHCQSIGASEWERKRTKLMEISRSSSGEHSWHLLFFVPSARSSRVRSNRGHALNSFRVFFRLATFTPGARWLFPWNVQMQCTKCTNKKLA